MTALTGEKLKAALEYYKAILTVETHFNDMLIRTRSFGLTIIGGLLAVSGASLSRSDPETVTLFCGLRFHVAAVFSLSALVIALVLYLLDRWYYYRLLIRSVECAERFEADNADTFAAIGVTNGGITTYLSSTVSRRVAGHLVSAFWGICMLICVILIFVARL